MQLENGSELESLMKLGKKVLAGMVLDYKDKFDTTLTNINKELTDLRNKFTKLESDLAVSKNINAKSSSQLTQDERKCWANKQCSRRECLEIPDIPDSISQNDLESKVYNIFPECDADIDPLNIEACHRLKSNHWPKKVIVKLVRRIDASKVPGGKKQLKTTDLSQNGFLPNTIVFVNESLCSYYRFLWSECKKVWSKNSIVFFWISNGSVRIKECENSPAMLVSHISDLVKRFNINVPSHDENEEEF